MARSKLSALLPIYLVIFFGFVGYSLMITIFTPLFLKESGILPPRTPMHVRTILLGIVLFVYPFGQFLSAPILGALSDRFGRKSILLFSLVVTAVCYALTALAITFSSLVALNLILFVAGLAEGNVVIAQSAIADITNETERTRYFGYIYMSASLAYVIGPLLGGKLADSSLVSWFNNAVPFWVTAALLFFNFIWVSFYFHETHSPEKRLKVKYFEAFTNLKNVFFSPKYRFLFFINFLLYIAIFGFFRSYPMYIVDEFNVGVSKLSEFVAWVAVPIVIVNLFMTGILSKYFSAYKLTLFSALMIGLTLEILIIPKALNALWITLFLAGAAVALGLPSSAAFLSSLVSSNEQGTIMGNNQSLQFFAEALSGLLGGLIAAILIKLTLITLGAVSFLAAALLFIYRKKQQINTSRSF